MGFCWKILCSQMLEVQTQYRADVHAMVLMPNHFHILLTTPNSDVDKIMKKFMESTTRIINAKAGRIGHLYGGRYHWSLIEDPIYFAHTYKYVLRNPVKAKLCQNVESYKFSSIFAGEVNTDNKPGPFNLLPPILEFHDVLPSEKHALLKWLNSPYRDFDSDEILNALKKSKFEFRVDRVTRKLPWMAEQI